MFGGLLFATQLKLNIHLYSIFIAAFLAAVSIIFLRHDLAKEVLFGGLSFACVYFILFLFILALFPSYVSDVFAVENLYGYHVAGMPIEELFFAFAVGAACAPLYEYVKGYKLI